MGGCFGLGHPLPSRERGIDWLFCLVVVLRCGYCLEASMTGRWFAGLEGNSHGCL